MLAISRSTRLFPLAGLLVSLAVAGPQPVAAADLDAVSATQGVGCDAPEVQSFSGVWRGHFTGGASAYPGPGSSVFLDWRDEKLCFPSRRSCDRWIGAMRRDFHHPEGYYTCLAIR